MTDIPEGPRQELPYQLDYEYRPAGAGVGVEGGVDKQKPQRNTALIAVVAAVSALILALGGYTVWKNNRPMPEPPVALGKAELKAAFKGGTLGTCDLGDEFWMSVGMHDVVIEDGVRCEGLMTAAEGPDVRVMIEVDPKQPAEGEERFDRTSWHHIEDPEADLPEWGQLDWEDAEGMRCEAASGSDVLNRLKLVSFGPCDALLPVAQQLDNIWLQWEYRPGARGLGDFTEPWYNTVVPGAPSAYSAFYKEAAEDAMAPGVRMEVEDFPRKGTTFAFTDLAWDGERFVYRAEFTLGTSNSGQSTYSAPDDFQLIYPDGSRITLSRPDWPSITRGDTVTVEGFSDTGVRPADGDVLLYASNSNNSPRVWQF